MGKSGGRTFDEKPEIKLFKRGLKVGIRDKHKDAKGKVKGEGKFQEGTDKATGEATTDRYHLDRNRYRQETVEVRSGRKIHSEDIPKALKDSGDFLQGMLKAIARNAGRSRSIYPLHVTAALVLTIGPDGTTRRFPVGLIKDAQRGQPEAAAEVRRRLTTALRSASS